MARFRLRPPQLSENDVERQCLDLLRLRHYRPVRLQSGRFWTLDKKRIITIGEPGIPDYVIPLFFVEVKRPGGELSPEQTTKIHELEHIYDVSVAVVDSLEEMLDWLNWLDAHPKL
jgi:hypothetical protein